MVRRSPFALGAFVPSFLVAGALGAQQQPAPSPAPAGWVVSGGLDAISFDGGRYLPGGTLHAGYERRLGAGRFGLRVAGDVWQQSDQPDGARYRTRDRIVGASVLGTLSLRPGARVRPYVLGGMGAYHLSQRITGERTVQNGVGVQIPVDVRAAGARFSPALTGGAGIETGLGGRAAVFFEARGVLVPNGGAGSARGPIRGLLLPVTVGVRF